MPLPEEPIIFLQAAFGDLGFQTGQIVYPPSKPAGGLLKENWVVVKLGKDAAEGCPCH